MMQITDKELNQLNPEVAKRVTLICFVAATSVLMGDIDEYNSVIHAEVFGESRKY